MSHRTNDLLMEMKGAFGASFGSDDLSEAGPMGKHLGKQAAGKKRKFGGGDSDRFSRKQQAAEAEKKQTIRAKTKELKAKGKARADRAEKGKEISKSFRKDAKSDGGKGGGSAGRAKHRHKRSASASSAGQQHHPFKRSANLGPGPLKTTHNQTKCWRCKCGDIYSSDKDEGCHCVSQGQGKNCPPKGTKKRIQVDYSYRQKYNKIYHKWRAGKGKEKAQRHGGEQERL